MTCHKTNLDLNAVKLNGVKVRETVPEDLNIPYTLIIKKGEEEEVMAALEKIIEQLKKDKNHDEEVYSRTTTACA